MSNETPSTLVAAVDASVDVPLVLGATVLDVAGARAFLEEASCSPARICRIDRGVFKAGALGEPVVGEQHGEDGRLSVDAPASWARTLTLRTLGEALYASGHGEAALALLDAVIQRDPSPRERATALSDVAAVAYGAGELDSARELLRAALRSYPAHPDALANAEAVAGGQGGAALRELVSARRLAVCERAPEGWEVVEVLPGQEVQLTALSSLPAGSYAELFVAGALERYDLSRAEGVLSGLRRLLVPSGRLTLSLSDAAAVGKALQHPELSVSEQAHLLRSLFGARGERASAYTVDIAVELLLSAGFVDVERWPVCPVAESPCTAVPAVRGISLVMHLTARAPG